MSGSATTPNYGFTLPTVGGDQNSWGGELNGNWTSLDSILHSVAASATSVAYLPLAGGQMTGALYLQGNPTQTNMAANMGYVTGNFLRLSGGSLTGGLAITGSLNASVNVVAGNNVYIANPAVGDFYLYRSSGNRGLNWAANWTDYWQESTGNRYWNSPSGILMTLTGGGNLTTSGSLTSSQILSNGTIYVNYPTVTDFYLTRAGGSRYLNWASNYYTSYQESTGQTNWVLNGTTEMSLTTAGELYVNGFVLANDHVQINGNGVVYAKWASNQVAFGWNGSTTDVYVDATHVGNIPFTASDERLKNVVGSYEAGLSEVLQIHPVRFTFNDAAPALLDKERTHVGILAQDVEPLFPEMVSMRDDVKHITGTDSVLWALVNSVKELAAEVAELKAGRA